MGAVLLTVQGCAPVLSRAAVATSPPAGSVIEVAFEMIALEGEEEPELPESELVLVWGPPGGEESRQVVGKVLSGCFEEAREGGPDILFLVCWFAGQGFTYHLHHRGDTLVLGRQYVSEEEPEAGEDPYEVLHRITLEPGTRVKAATR